MRVRKGGRVVKVAVMVATGVNNDGYREVRGVSVSTSESHSGWLTFFKDLVARGLSEVALVTSGAHTGLVEAIGATLPGASWQPKGPGQRHPAVGGPPAVTLWGRGVRDGLR